MSKFKKLTEIREFSILIIFIVFCIIMTIASPYFLTWTNIANTILGAAVNMVMCVAMTVILAGGGIDLSVGCVMSMSSVVTGALVVGAGGYVSGGSGAGGAMGVWPAAVCGIIAAAVIGLINGIICAKTTIAPMICTLGTMSIAKGIAMVLSSGSGISISGKVSESFFVIGKGKAFGFFPTIILIALIIAIIFGFLLRKSSVMRKVYYVGSNPQAAEFSGIRVSKIKLGMYLCSSVLCGIAGVMNASRFSVCSPVSGDGAEMTCISAAVIGGASLNGGSGSILGTMLGLLLLTFINNALVLLSVNVYWQEFINGAILLLAVLVDFFSHRKDNLK